MDGNVAFEADISFFNDNSAEVKRGGQRFDDNFAVELEVILISQEPWNWLLVSGVLVSNGDLNCTYIYFTDWLHDM